LIDSATLQKAQRMIAGCDACSEDAEIPFDNILDRVTGSDPSVTDYVLEVPTKCLQCCAAIMKRRSLNWPDKSGNRGKQWQVGQP
jgi:hypothetical protein